jgi:hypothetical protein
MYSSISIVRSFLSRPLFRSPWYLYDITRETIWTVYSFVRGSVFLSNSYCDEGNAKRITANIAVLYVELPVRTFWLISVEAIHLDFYCIFLYKFLCSLAWEWSKYRPKHAAYMWRQFNRLSKLGTSLDNFFSVGTDSIYSHHIFVKIVATEMVLA